MESSKKVSLIICVSLNRNIVAWEARNWSPLVTYPAWCHQTWLENPRTEWRSIARKITYFYGPFSSQPCLITGGYWVSEWGLTCLESFLADGTVDLFDFIWVWKGMGGNWRPLNPLASFELLETFVSEPIRFLGVSQTA